MYWWFLGLPWFTTPKFDLANGRRPVDGGLIQHHDKSTVFFRWNHVATCFTGATYCSGGYNGIIQNVRLRLELILQLSHNVLVICHWIIDLNDHGISWVYSCAISHFPDVFQELREVTSEVPGFAGRFPGTIGRSWFEQLKPQDRWLRKSVLTSGSVGNCHFYLRYDRCLRVTTRIWKVSTCFDLSKSARKMQMLLMNLDGTFNLSSNANSKNPT